MVRIATFLAKFEATAAPSTGMGTYYFSDLLTRDTVQGLPSEMTPLLAKLPEWTAKMHHAGYLPLLMTESPVTTARFAASDWVRNIAYHNLNAMALQNYDGYAPEYLAWTQDTYGWKNSEQNYLDIATGVHTHTKPSRNVNRNPREYPIDMAWKTDAVLHSYPATGKLVKYLSTIRTPSGGILSENTITDMAMSAFMRAAHEASAVKNGGACRFPFAWQKTPLMNAAINASGAAATKMEFDDYAHHSNNHMRAFDAATSLGLGGDADSGFDAAKRGFWAAPLVTDDEYAVIMRRRVAPVRRRRTCTCGYELYVEFPKERSPTCFRVRKEEGKKDHAAMARCWSRRTT